MSGFTYVILAFAMAWLLQLVIWSMHRKKWT
jgi:hypothetical protein